MAKEVDNTTVHHGSAPRGTAKGVFVLVLVDGPDRSKTFVVDGSAPSRVLIGQSPVCDLRLTDRSVSRRHIALEMGDRCLRVTDLDSTNGAYLGATRIASAFWHEGEILRLGTTAIRLDMLPLPQKPPDSTIQSFGPVVGASAPMRRLYPLCHKLAASDVPVIIEGETGTGKEVLAEALHELGPRGDQPFVVFDCTEVPPSLVESELFGHERGAFTGATDARQGFFEQAHGGTLLIDEIGDLSLALQPKLLRALERSEVRRVGGTRRIPVNVRVIAATRRDLDKEVYEGRFRDDLFHRLAVARVELPPLHKRKGDVPLLARHFAHLHGAAEDALAPEVLARWEAEPWPGNIRELRNAVQRQIALGDLDTQSSGPATVHSDDIIDLVLSREMPLGPSRQLVVDEFERRYLTRVLQRHDGNVTHAARAAGVARRYFHLLRSKKLG